MTAVNQQHEKYFLSETNYRLLSGAVSGIVSRTVVFPFERVVILRQTNDSQYARKSLIETLSKLIRSEGVLCLFKGSLANCFRIGPFQAIEFYTFDMLKKTLLPMSQPVIGQKLSLLVSGGVSGALALLVVYPFDLTKTLLAVQHTQNTEYKGIANTMLQVVRNRGFLALWRGVSATLVGITPYSGLKLTFFQLIRQKFDRVIGQQNGAVQNILFGGVAGCAALTITYPTDVIRRRLQVQIINDQQRKSYLATAREMYQNTGLRGFYTGLLPTYLKVIPSTAIAFCINEQFKKRRSYA